MKEPWMSEQPRGLTVLVPCHNEELAIEEALEEIARVTAATGLPHEIIVIDDGSTDRSAERVDTGRFKLLGLPRNMGYGAALKRGARLAQYDVIVITDADGTYPFARLPELLEALGEADMAVGARTGAEVEIPPLRVPAKWLLTQLARWLTGMNIPDLNSGFRAIRRELWMRFESYYPDGFSLTTTITLAALTNGYRVAYQKIDYHPRLGESKIRPVRDTLNFIQLILRTVLYFDPLKIFVPLSMGVFLISFIVGFLSLLEGRLMDVTTVILFITGLQLLMIGMLADLIVKRMK